VLCVQCGMDSRCAACYPYERPSDREARIGEAVRDIRENPQVGLLTGAFMALAAALFTWLGFSTAPPGVLRVLGSMAGAVASCAFLGAGAAYGKVPLPGEVPRCRSDDPTLYDWLAFTGFGALVAQVVLVCRCRHHLMTV
jgi:hypothetical protein